jgi:hypothetical protein
MAYYFILNISNIASNMSKLSSARILILMVITAILNRNTISIVRSRCQSRIMFTKYITQRLSYSLSPSCHLTIWSPSFILLLSEITFVLTHIIKLMIVFRMFCKSWSEISIILVYVSWRILQYSCHIRFIQHRLCLLRLNIHMICTAFRIYTISSCHFHHIINLFIIHISQIPRIIFSLSNRSPFILSPLFIYKYMLIVRYDSSRVPFRLSIDSRQSFQFPLFSSISHIWLILSSHSSFLKVSPKLLIGSPSLFIPVTHKRLFVETVTMLTIFYVHLLFHQSLNVHLKLY